MHSRYHQSRCERSWASGGSGTPAAALGPPSSAANGCRHDFLGIHRRQVRFRRVDVAGHHGRHALTGARPQLVEALLGQLQHFPAFVIDRHLAA